MNRDPSYPDSSGDEDSWESLAENLFGIEFRSDAGGDDAIGPEDLASEIAESPPASTEPERPAPQPIEAPTEPAPTSGLPETPEFGDFGDEDLEAGEEGEEGDDFLDDEAEEGEPVGEEVDTYWDPLKDWDWGVEDEAAIPEQGGRRREARSDRERRPRAERPSRERESRPPREAAETAAPASDEFFPDDDFGAGLVDDVPPPAPRRAERTRPPETSHPAEHVRPAQRPPADRVPQPAAREEPGAEAESEEDGKRRRRRRRRRGRAESESPAGGTGQAPAEELEMEAEDLEVAGEVAEPDFGEEEPLEAPREPSRKGRSRRRRRRGEPRSVEPAPADFGEEPAGVLADWEADEEEPLAVEEEETAEAVAEGDEEDLPVDSNVPTWDEAISYLLGPRPAARRDDEPQRSQGRSEEKGRSRSRRRRR